MNYRYEACNRHGEHLHGVLEAASRQEAAHKIRRQGLWITALTCVDKDKQSRWTEALGSYLAGRVDTAQTALFCRQLAVLLGAGIPVHEALKSLLVGGNRGRYSRLLNELYQKVLKGQSLSAAMESSHNFSPQIVRLVAAGEFSGTLEVTFSRLADFLSQMVKTREQLKSVLLYPSIIGFTAIAVLLFMTVFILPSFAVMLNNLHTALPWPTMMLLGTAEFLQVHGVEAMLAAVLFSGGAYVLSKQDSVAYAYQRLLLMLPLIGTLAQNTSWALILSTLSMLLSQGIPLHEAIKMAAPVAGNRYLEAELLKVHRKVEQGNALLSALQACPVFPAILYEMLEAGEQAGQLEIMLAKAAAFCKVLAENESARLQALAEPAAIFTVGGLVFFMVLAVIMPLLDTMDALAM